MKTLMTYIKGFTIGMIAEYCLRVQYGYLQGVILVCFVLIAIIEIVNDWYEN